MVRGQIGRRSVKQELRENLLARIAAGDSLFRRRPRVRRNRRPQIVNALLSRHNFILLGLRGQAKSRILRGLAQFLDAEIPPSWAARSTTIPMRPHLPRLPRSDRRGRRRHADRWLPREQRYVEKLATPDVTIADMIGDVDPIKAARGGRDSPTN